MMGQASASNTSRLPLTAAAWIEVPVLQPHENLQKDALQPKARICLESATAAQNSELQLHLQPSTLSLHGTGVLE